MKTPLQKLIEQLDERIEKAHEFRRKQGEQGKILALTLTAGLMESKQFAENLLEYEKEHLSKFVTTYHDSLFYVPLNKNGEAHRIVDLILSGEVKPRIEVNRQILTDLVKGSCPAYEYFEHKLFLKAGFSYSDQYGNYRYSSLDKLTEDELSEIYELCKKSK
jgi:hypothetical protein